jgi:flagellar motor switch protein FliN/FliY
VNPLAAHADPVPPAESLDAGALLDVQVRLSVEIGRVRMPLAQAVALASGTIIDLDRRFEEPVEVYVNGRHFGAGRLLAADGEWALRLDHIDTEDPDPGDLAAPEETPDHAALEGVEQPSSADSAHPGDAD